jgi:cytochrome c-type biogenesis protein CcmF
MLAKRRKYGGYIVHLGIAVMFFGFAGKAYDKMIDRTVDKPGIVNTGNGTGPSSFAFGHYKGPFSNSDYTFTYERLIHTSDDHKDAVTAQVGIYDHGMRIGTVYPAKWDYHSDEAQMTSEIAIRVRLAEDVYLVLTGFDLESQKANFRIYLNPLILWVWIGFLILAVGTLICLIPQSLVDFLQFKPKTRLGRAADLSVILLLAGGLIMGLASQAHAQAEHAPPAGMGMGAAGGGYAAQNRPDTPTAEKAMKELICPCGCARQNIFECDCATAADLRARALSILSSYDLKTEQGRRDGYNAVMKKFVSEYTESVLATPKSNFPWLLPSVAAVGALGLLVVVGRRWMNKKPATAAPNETAATAVDDKYTDKLDDELAETD